MSIRGLRSWLYWTARLLGDVQAIQRGPDAVGKRVVRRVVGRLSGRLLRRLVK